MKICIRCKTEKDIKYFENHPTSKDGKRNQCSSCRYQLRIIRDPEYKAKQRDWNLGRYGITESEYQKIFLQQNKECAICKTTDFGKHKKPFVDHDHITLSIRGLLCNSCNSLLGHAKDSPQILERAIAYLIKIRSSHEQS